MAQTVKHLSTMRETQVLSLGWEDPLKKEMAIHSSTIAWKIPWIEEPGRLQSMGSQRVGHDWATPHSHSVNNNVWTSVQELQPVCHTDERCQQEKRTEEYMETLSDFFCKSKTVKNKNKNLCSKNKKSQWDIFEGVGGGKKEKLSTLKFTWNDTWMTPDKFSIYD